MTSTNVDSAIVCQTNVEYQERIQKKFPPTVHRRREQKDRDYQEKEDQFIDEEKTKKLRKLKKGEEYDPDEIEKDLEIEFSRKRINEMFIIDRMELEAMPEKWLMETNLYSYLFRSFRTELSTKEITEWYNSKESGRESAVDYLKRLREEHSIEMETSKEFRETKNEEYEDETQRFVHFKVQVISLRRYRGLDDKEWEEFEYKKRIEFWKKSIASIPWKTRKRLEEMCLFSGNLIMDQRNFYRASIQENVSDIQIFLFFKLAYNNQLDAEKEVAQFQRIEASIAEKLEMGDRQIKLFRQRIEVEFEVKQKKFVDEKVAAEEDLGSDEILDLTPLVKKLKEEFIANNCIFVSDDTELLDIMRDEKLNIEKYCHKAIKLELALPVLIGFFKKHTEEIEDDLDVQGVEKDA